MFTGLIEHLARLQSLTPQDSADGQGFTLTFAEAAPILADCTIGDSIAVNGACLTVTEFGLDVDGGWFKVGLAPETLKRTDLGELKINDFVNCERAMAAHTRFGGHMVQGHVDGTCTIQAIEPIGNSLGYTFELPADSPYTPFIIGQLIPKGYITLDGTSLTLTGIDRARLQFSVMLIAHTQEKVVMTRKQVGDRVNVECDAVGKWVLAGVEGALAGLGEGAAGSDGKDQSALARLVEGAVERVVERKLKEKGLI